MKSKSIIYVWLGGLGLAVSTAPTPCRADDYITYSVPFSIPPPAVIFDPVVSTTFSDNPSRSGGAVGGRYTSLEVRKYGIDLNGAGWAFNPDNGIQSNFGAASYVFPVGPEIGIPKTESEFYGRLGLWHKLAPAWTVSANVNAIAAGEGSLDGKDIRPGFTVDLDYRPTDSFVTYIRVGETMIQGTAYGSPSIGFSWDFAPRWQLAGSLSYSVDTAFPRAVVRYQLTDKLHIYGGLVTEGSIFDVKLTRSNPSLPYLYYYQRDLKIGLDWKVFKGWDIGTSIGYSLNQEFNYRR